MELVNTTPVPTEARVVPVAPRPGAAEDPSARRLLVFAKATYRVERGRLVLEDQRPLGLRPTDVELDASLLLPDAVAPEEPPGPDADLVLLARDDLARDDEVVEVMVAGHAHAPGGRPVRAMISTLRVGASVHELFVVGDRTWKGGLLGAHPSDPEPFVRMPLTWSRAFGGTTAAVFDGYGTVVDMRDPKNPHGRGFDARKQAEAFARYLKSPSGYPVLASERRLPNLEHPSDRVQSPDDEPEPACWAAMPLSLGVLALELDRAMRAHVDAGGEPNDPPAALFHRAAPGLCFDRLPPGTRVALENVHRAGPWGFELPDVAPVLDVCAGSSTFEVRPALQRVLLRPDEGVVELRYGAITPITLNPGDERSARARWSSRS